jgi:hypothetical protein
VEFSVVVFFVIRCEVFQHELHQWIRQAFAEHVHVLSNDAPKAKLMPFAGRK